MWYNTRHTNRWQYVFHFTAALPNSCKGRGFYSVGTHQNKARWGNPSSALLSVCTQSGSGELIHWIDRPLLDTEDTERDMRENSFLTTVCDLFDQNSPLDLL